MPTIIHLNIICKWILSKYVHLGGEKIGRLGEKCSRRFVQVRLRVQRNSDRANVSIGR